MKSITIERVIHNCESRIALRFPYDSELVSKVRSIPGSRWSMTMKCWHLPDDPLTTEKMIQVFGDVFTEKPSGIPGFLDDDKSIIRQPGLSEQFPKVKKSGDFTEHADTLVRKSEGKVLDIPYTPDGMRTESVRIRSEYGPVEFKINESDGKLIIRFTGKYSQEWIKELKSYGRVWFDSVSMEWQMSWSRMKVDSLSDYFSSQGVEVIVKRAVFFREWFTGFSSRHYEMQE